MIQTDRNASNGMIVKNTPRIYVYKQNYYIVEGDSFYWIDFQGITMRQNLIKSDLVFFNYFTDEQKGVIDKIFENSEDITPEKVLDTLFGWLSTKVQVFNRVDAEIYMVVNYNHKMILVDKLVYKIINL